MADDTPGRAQGILFAAGIGAVAGACLGTRRRAAAAAGGGIVLAASEAVARRLQKPARSRPCSNGS